MDKVIVLRNGVRVPMIGFGTSTTINKDILLQLAAVSAIRIGCY